MKTASTTSDIFNDGHYATACAELLDSARKESCDVIQMPNGDLIVMEVQITNHHYAWDPASRQMIRQGSSPNAPSFQAVNNNDAPLSK